MNWMQKGFDDHTITVLFLIEIDSTQFLCPIEALYCCFECSMLRPYWDVQQEVTSFYCTQCLTSLTPAEAMAQNRWKIGNHTYTHDMNTCYRCFDCPNCLVALAYAMTTSGTRESYCLICLHCFWSSKSVPNLIHDSLEGLVKSTKALSKARPEFQYTHKILQSNLTKIISDTRKSSPFLSSLSQLSPETLDPFSEGNETTPTTDPSQSRVESTFLSYARSLDEILNPEIPSEKDQLQSLVDSLQQTHFECTPALTNNLALPRFQWTDLIQNFPISRSLSALHDIRCIECGRYVIKTQGSPNLPLRLNLCAINILPSFQLIRVYHTGSKPPALADPLEKRFALLTPDTSYTMDLVVTNVMDQVPLDLSFDFCETSSTKILSSPFSLHLKPFDDLLENSTPASKKHSDSPCILAWSEYQSTLRLVFATKKCPNAIARVMADIRHECVFHSAICDSNYTARLSFGL